jgi:uridine phosphorylase
LTRFPIHPDKWQQPALLSAEDMIAFRRRHGGLAGVTPPPTVILCLYTGVIDHFAWRYRCRRVDGFLSQLYLVRRRRQAVGVMGRFGIGAPVVASLADELGAWGCQRLILLSLAGGLQPGLASGDIVIADRAIRDEGASYHYLAPHRSVGASARLVSAVSCALARRSLPHRIGSTWSTDAPYRETRAEADAFRAEGVLTVDMESAGLFAVGLARAADTASVFVVGDSLAGPRWAAPVAMRPLHERLKLVLDVLVSSF